MIGIENDGPTRILLLGMECAFSEPIAETLLATPGTRVVAIVLAGTTPRAQTGELSRMRQIAASKNVPIVEVSDRTVLWSGAFRCTLAGFGADLIVVACFPWRLPPAIVSLPNVASLNVHPSLLPDGRGPEPIFWAFRRGLEWTGVSLHIIDSGLDTGPIVSQQRVAIAGDATMITLERSLAEVGAELLHGLFLGGSPLSAARPQAADAENAAPFPGVDDLLVTTAWDGTAAARFINAVSPVYGTIEVLVLATGQRLAVVEVLDIAESAPGPPVVSIQGDCAWIDFANGRLHCRLRTLSQQLTFKANCKKIGAGDEDIG